MRDTKNVMTVAELINTLSAYPGEMPVAIWIEGYFCPIGKSVKPEIEGGFLAITDSN